MKYQRKKLEELNLIDDFLFFEALSGEKGTDLCRLLIRAVCGREVREIRIRPQHIIQGSDTYHHGIRMDLYVDGDGIYPVKRSV